MMDTIVIEFVVSPLLASKVVTQARVVTEASGQSSYRECSPFIKNPEISVGL